MPELATIIFFKQIKIIIKKEKDMCYIKMILIYFVNLFLSSSTHGNKTSTLILPWTLSHDQNEHQLQNYIFDYGLSKFFWIFSLHIILKKLPLYYIDVYFKLTESQTIILTILADITLKLNHGTRDKWNVNFRR